MDAEAILDASRHPRYEGELAGATHEARGANLSCGDEICWSAIIQEGEIRQLRHVSRACSVCRASAEIVASQFEGKPLEMVTITDEVAYLENFEIPLSEVRKRCAMLPLQTLKKLAPKTSSD